MCAVNTESEAPKVIHRLARERFVHPRAVHWGMLGVRILLPAAAGFDLLLTRSDDEYTFCR